MKPLKIAAIALSLLGLMAGPAAALTLDYTLTVPLVSSAATDLTPDTTLRGTFTYDTDDGATKGTFSIGDVSDNFAGTSFILDFGDDATGFLFTGDSANDSNLYISIDTGSGMLGSVNYCPTGGCSSYTAIGGSLEMTASPPASDVSPVPLPPAVAMFGGALLALAGLGAGRRVKLQRRALART